MKFSIPTSILIETLNINRPLTSNKSNHHNFFIEVNDKELIITSTDGERFITTRKTRDDCEILSTGSVCVSSRILDSVLKTLSGDITLEVINNHKSGQMLSIMRGSGTIYSNHNSVFTLVTSPTNSFPVSPKNEYESSIVIPSDVLSKIISKTFYCVSIDETRTILNSVYLKEINGQITAYSTDGRRLVSYNTNITAPVGFSLIIPSRTVNILEAVIKSNKADILIRYCNMVAEFSNPTFIFTTPLISEYYPPITKVIPDITTMIGIPFNVIDLTGVIRRVMVMSDDQLGNAINLNFGKNKLTIESCNRTDVLGSAIDSIGITSSQNITIRMNSNFILDSLKALNSDEGIFYIKDDISPAVVAQDNEIHIIMPLRKNL